MPNLTNNIHYVKFMRGSISSWETLKTTPERISDDTLYFIYENAQASTNGKLYLGQKLISGANDLSENININDIGDINIDGEQLADKQILVYNNTSQKWENTTLSTIINTAVGVMVGASDSQNGISGLVPVPKTGDQNKFLKGDGTWATVNIPTFNTDIFTLNNNEVTLNDFNFASVGSVPIKTQNGLEWTNVKIGTLNRQITTLEKLQAQLNGTDPDPIDVDTIYMVLNGNDDSTGDKYDEYMIINNKLEKLGSFGQVNLNNYVQVPTFNTAISSLNNILQDTIDDNTGKEIPGLISRVSTIEASYITQADIGDLSLLFHSTENSTLVDEVNTLGERLRWHELQNN